MSIQGEISEKMRNRAELSREAEGQGDKKRVQGQRGVGAAEGWEEEKVLMYSRLLCVKYLCCNPWNSQ